MAQPRSSKSSGAKRPAAKRSSASAARSGGGAKRASGSTAKRSSSASRSSTTRSSAKSATTRKTSAKRTPAKRTPAKRTPAKRTPAKRTAARSTDAVANLREQIQKLLPRMNLVMLSTDRIQSALDDAVERGRMTRSDANQLVSDLVKRGREQTENVLADLEQLLGTRRSRGRIEAAATDARKRAGATARKAVRSEPVDRVMQQADRARRAAGLPPSFPILAYDDLTAAQVTQRVGGLTPAQLRKVRDYERRHANRKGVLATIEKALG